MFHVFLVFVSEELNTFGFICSGCCKQKDSCSSGQCDACQRWEFKEDAPCQKQQRTIKRVANIFIHACCDKVCCFLESKQRIVTFTLCRWTATCSQEMDSITKRDEGNEQECPRDELIPCKGVLEPILCVNHKQEENTLPCKEAIKTM